MNTVLGIEFIKFFDDATQDVAAEGPWLLHLDGHRSHMTLEFLLYAKDHNIIVLGYPPHCTHILQGLDVVVFSPLECAYALHATKFYETTHNAVDKAEFLTILGMAVDDAITESNILLAWRKTGLHPVDPSVITPEMLTPSKVFAPEETFPVPPSSPIQGVVAAFKQMHIGSTPPTVSPLLGPSLSDFSNPISSSPHDRHNFPSHLHPVPDAITSLSSGPVESPPLKPMDSVQSLAVGVAPSATAAANQIISAPATTQASFLVDNNLTTADELPPIETSAFPHDLITKITSMTSPPSHEEWIAIKQSITGLHQSYVCLFCARQRCELLHQGWWWQVVVFGLWQTVSKTAKSYQTVLAHNVLQDLHCKKLLQALAAKEKSEGQKRNVQQLLGINSGQILTGDAMISALLADEEARAAKESSKEPSKAFKDLKATYNAWKTQATADKTAKHAQNHAEWELKCLALPPGTWKLKNQHTQSIRTLQHNLGLLASERNQHGNI